MHPYILYVHIYTTYAQPIYTHIGIRPYAYTRMPTHIGMHAYAQPIYTHIGIRTYVDLRLQGGIYSYIIYICMYAHICMPYRHHIHI